MATFLIATSIHVRSKARQERFVLMQRILSVMVAGSSSVCSSRSVTVAYLLATRVGSCLSYFPISVKRHHNKTIYRRKHLLELTVLEGESMTIMMGTWQQAGKYDPRIEAGSLYPETQL